MAVARHLVQNQLMRIPSVREMARSRYSTGILDDAAEGSRILEEFSRFIPQPINGLNILELGPGRGTALMRAARQRGANYSAFDVVDHLGTLPFDDLEVDYRVDAGGRLSWDDETFDVVWSFSVLEHVRTPSQILRDSRRVLRPGGLFVAFIDLESHSGGRRDPQRVFDFLRYPEWLWLAMTSNRSTYVNRLRASHWRREFTDNEFTIVNDEPEYLACGLDPLREVPYLSALSDDDTLTRRLTLVGQRDL